MQTTQTNLLRNQISILDQLTIYGYFLWLFLSILTVHIKQRGADFHEKEFLFLLNPLHQPTKTSITPLGITHCILNKAKVKDHSSVATSNEVTNGPLFQ